LFHGSFERERENNRESNGKETKASHFAQVSTTTALDTRRFVCVGSVFGRRPFGWPGSPPGPFRRYCSFFGPK
jgi:hypothetical protein